MSVLDPIELRLLTGALRAACEEMGVVLVRSAHSANIKERRDASTALFNARGEIKIDDPELAADQFLNLVLGHCKRLNLYGIAGDPKSEERYRKAAVEFFLVGVRSK